MPMQLIITGNDGLDLATQVHNFCAGIQNPAGIPAASAKQAAVNKPDAEPEAKEEKVPKKGAAKKEEKAADAPAASKYTLQQAIDAARDIAGDGKDQTVMAKLVALNTRFGIGKVRELPADKLDAYMADLEKEFPKPEAPAAGSMFD